MILKKCKMVSVFTQPDVNTWEVGRTRDKRRKPRREAEWFPAYRANHSCETILIKITDEWLAAMDEGLFTGVVMINLRKAFDVVDHKLLLKKLQVYGLNTDSLKWFQSYLSGRYQKVSFDGKLSEPLGIHSGVLLFSYSS